MPELPEVYAVVEELRRGDLTGKPITAVTVGWPRTVGEAPEDFVEALVDRSISGFRQHGKYIFMELDTEGTVSVHLRMSGKLYASRRETPWNGYERVILHLEDSREIRFYDPRKFGRMIFHRDIQDVLTRLGVVPLSQEFTPERLKTILANRRRRLKPLLLDQTVISGLGNIYTDEALWRAGIHPLRLCGTLRQDEINSLHESIRCVLLQGIANGGTRLGEGKSNFMVHHGGPLPTNQLHLKVFRRTGEPCLRCGHPVDRIIVAQRSTHICPNCQPFLLREP